MSKSPTLLRYEWGSAKQAFWNGGGTRSQASSASGHPAPIAFLSGFQFGFIDKCRGQAALWPAAEPELLPPSWAHRPHVSWDRPGSRTGPEITSLILMLCYFCVFRVSLCVLFLSWQGRRWKRWFLIPPGCVKVVIIFIIKCQVQAKIDHLC